MMKQLVTNLFLSIISIIKVLILSRFKINISRYQAKNNACVILGNGPSLIRSIENAQFEEEDILCVNNFVSSHLYDELKPNIYVVGAPIFFKEEHTLPNEYIELRDAIFKGLVVKTKWALILMVPYVAKKSKFFQFCLKQNTLIKPYYYNPTPIEGLSKFSHLLFSLGLGMPRPHNVLIPSIMNCILLGYKKIYLIGADHSWLSEIAVNEKNEALVNQKHFYDENETKPEKMQDYINRPRMLHEILHKFYLSFKGYWDIKAYAQKKGVTIYNCSETSMIDAFERGKLDKLINTPIQKK